ncbi:MAG: hypothetical protein NVSMB14_05610 [Isosphaeraceae bacterium]
MMLKSAYLVLPILCSLVCLSPAEKHFPRKAGAETKTDDRVGPPPPRARSEVEALLSREPKPKEVRPLRILLVSSKQDHGPGEHDYPAWSKGWKELLGSAKGVTVDTAKNWPDKEQWEKSDLVILYFWNHDWSAKRY